jgi:hypothetical protein
MKQNKDDATAYASKLPNGAISVMVINKDEERDLELTLDFGAAYSGPVETETLHAPAIDLREAHVTRPTSFGALKLGWWAATVPRAFGMQTTVLEWLHRASKIPNTPFTKDQLLNNYWKLKIMNNPLR